MTQQGEAPAEKPRRRFTKGHIIALAVLAVLSAVWYILLGSTRVLFVSTILFCFWGFSKKTKRNTILLLLVTLLVLWLGFYTAPVVQKSRTLWKYPIQRAYISLYGYDEPDYFAGFEEDVKGEFEFDYMPSILQGIGHYSVFFETDEDTVRRYDERFSKQAKFSFTLNEYKNELIYDGRIPELDRNKKGNFSRISLYIGGSSDDGRLSATAQIYVLETNLDFNHPHTSAVIIDKENNTIFLTRLG
ncbi:MAG: hypothetical protein IKR76_11580 [Ruminococcus sp.]|nr:hypothetical protein [Ruminococcus sp.]